MPPISPLDPKLNSDADDQLLSILSIVVKSNVEYTKGVTELIASDVEKRKRIDSLTETTEELVRAVEKLEEAQEELTNKVDEALQHHMELKSKFKPLYVTMGLKEDGTEFSPSDKLVVKVKAALSHKLTLIVVGVILTYAIKFLGKVL